MRRFAPTAALACVLAVAFGACDTQENDRPDAEEIVGTWEAATANVRVRNVPVGVPVGDLAAQGDEQVFTFRADGGFTFRFDPAEGRRLRVSYQGTTYVNVPLTQTVNLAGTYTLDEAGRRLTFSTVPQTTQDDFELAYDFNSEGDALELIAEDPETLRILFGLADEDYEVIADVVAGASVSYDRQ
jgi:hypothetical protein